MQAHQWEPGFSFSFGCSPLKTSLRTKYRMQRNMKNEYSVQGLPPRVRQKKGSGIRRKQGSDQLQRHQEKEAKF